MVPIATLRSKREACLFRRRAVAAGGPIDCATRVFYLEHGVAVAWPDPAPLRLYALVPTGQERLRIVAIRRGGSVR